MVSMSHLAGSKGLEMAKVMQQQNAFLLCEHGAIIAYGSMDGCPDRAEQIIDARGGSVLPGWCDSHTHLVLLPAVRKIRVPSEGHELC